MVTQTKRNIDSPINAGSKRNLVETMLSPVVAVYDLVSGPPLNYRERRRRAGFDANGQMGVSVSPYHLSHR